MRCLRCGIEIDPPEVFCESCREFMKQSPVSRETPLVLQPRPEYTPMRPRPLKPEEQISQARMALLHSRKVSLFLGFVILFLCVMLAISFRFGDKAPIIGQNYTTVQTTSPTTLPTNVP